MHKIPTWCINLLLGLGSPLYINELYKDKDVMRDTNTSGVSASPAAPKLLEQVRQRLRVKHYALRTEQSYLTWIRNYILFHNKRHPAEMAAAEIESFLSYLAVDRAVSPATHLRRTDPPRSTETWPP